MNLKLNTLYIQTQDVTNPAPDRRKTTEPLAATIIPAGTRWRCNERTVRIDAERVITYQTLTLFDYRHEILSEISKGRSPRATNRNGDGVGPELWDLLAPTLVEATGLTACDEIRLADRCGSYGPYDGVLDSLYRLGKVTREDLLAALQEYHDELDRKENGDG